MLFGDFISYPESVLFPHMYSHVIRHTSEKDAIGAVRFVFMRSYPAVDDRWCMRRSQRDGVGEKAQCQRDRTAAPSAEFHQPGKTQWISVAGTCSIEFTVIQLNLLKYEIQQCGLLRIQFLDDARLNPNALFQFRPPAFPSGWKAD